MPARRSSRPLRRSGVFPRAGDFACPYSSLPSSQRPAEPRGDPEPAKPPWRAFPACRGVARMNEGVFLPGTERGTAAGGGGAGGLRAYGPPASAFGPSGPFPGRHLPIGAPRVNCLRRFPLPPARRVEWHSRLGGRTDAPETLLPMDPAQIHRRPMATKRGGSLRPSLDPERILVSSAYLPNCAYCSLPTKPNLETFDALITCSTLAERS